ncbi:taste receptor type 2 member 116-like [Ochotona curzoniae]|uniref:taste receptor type 2 member 116-like n=1 Tax=Ochotona curzoniae TaxID=130825 RepID=UPI001B351EC4|nr:taste receptor type 2 member 116-like [Ochotona curzoniae]
MTLDYISTESAHLFTTLMLIDSLFMVIPFTKSLTAFLLLIFSLWRHLRKMQLNAMGSRDASTKAHLKGLQTECTLLVIVSIEFIIGILGNGFIALVNVIDWVKRKKISPVDQILTALAVSRITQVSFIHVNRLISVKFPTLFWDEQILKITNSIWIVTNHLNMWLATSLSIFYFFKIANFSNSTFLYLKWRVGKVVSGILLMSSVILVLNIAFMKTDIEVWVDDSNKNVTYSSNSKELFYSSRSFTINYMTFTIIPSIVSVTTFVLLIFSLWRHLRNMQLIAMGFRDASTKAHLQVLMTMVALLLLYAFLFLSLLMQVLMSEIQEKNVAMLLCHVLALTFPSGHSYILILGNKKLRQTSLSVLGWLGHRCKQAEP